MLELFTPEFIEKLSPETLRGLGVGGLEEAPVTQVHEAGVRATQAPCARQRD